MKTRKRVFSWLLTLAMAFCLLPAAAYADDALPVPVAESSIVWDSEAATLTMPGTAGQEYAAVEYEDGTLDWAEAIVDQPVDDPGSEPFDDVTDSDYFAKPVAWAYTNGIMAGTSPAKFSPDLPCTGEQVEIFLRNAKAI